jgi:hypothetical protein
MFSSIRPPQYDNDFRNPLPSALDGRFGTEIIVPNELWGFSESYQQMLRGFVLHISS